MTGEAELRDATLGLMEAQVAEERERAEAAEQAFEREQRYSERLAGRLEAQSAAAEADMTRSRPGGCTSWASHRPWWHTRTCGRT